jgi:hypothetical protein
MLFGPITRTVAQAPATRTASRRDRVDLIAQDHGCDCGGQRYNWVLNFASVKELARTEWHLVLEEIQRHGFGTSYNHPDWRISVCITLARDACHVDDAVVARGVALGLGLVEPPSGRNTVPVQFVRFHLPQRPGVFDALYTGPAEALLVQWARGRSAGDD